MTREKMNNMCLSLRKETIDMKKIMALLLTGLMAVSLTACGGSSKSDDTADAVTETESETTEAEDTSEGEDTDADAAEEEDSTIVLENFEDAVMVYEDGDDTFEVKSVELADDGLFVHYEAHAASNGYRSGVEIGGLVINGCYMGSYLDFCDERDSEVSSTVATYGEGWFRVDGEILAAYGITEMEEIRFGVTLYDYSDYGSHEHVSFDVDIYPGTAKEVAYEPVDNAIVLIDNEDITISIAGGGWYTHASGWLLGYWMFVCCSGNSDADCSVSIDSITLEGLDCTFGYYTFYPNAVQHNTDYYALDEFPVAATVLISFEDADAKSDMSYDDAVSAMSSLNATIEITYYEDGNENGDGEGVTSTVETDLMALSGPFTPSGED